MDHAGVIEALGGPSALARALDLRYPSVVSRWRTRGIPARRWSAIVAVARECGVPLSFEELAAGGPQATFCWAA